MLRGKSAAPWLAGTALAIVCATPAGAQDDVTRRLAALEAQLATQQAIISRQQAEIDALKRDTAVPDTLPGDPVTPTDIFVTQQNADDRPPESGVAVVTPDQVRGPAAPQRDDSGEDAQPSTGVDTLGTQVRRAVEASKGLAIQTLERPRLTLAGGRPTFVSADGGYSLSLRGFVQADAGFHFQDAAGPLNLDRRRGSQGGGRENNAAADLSNGANFRRARLGVEGVLDRDFSYRLQIEYGGSGTEGPARINDAWIAYTGFAPFTIQAGAFSPPANMDDGQSPEDQLFLERATSAELSRTLGGADGRVGIGVRGNGLRWFGAVTATGPTVNDAETFDEQLAVVGRAAYLIATDDLDFTYNVQLGLNGTRVFLPADQGVAATPRYPFRFRDRPELRLDGTRLIDTGVIDAASVSTYGVEGGAQYRNFYLQAEAFRYQVERRNSTLANPDFSGGYVEGTWILTGEFRRHNIATASFLNPRPYRSFSPANGGFGAVELAARYSWVDLNYRAGTAGTAAAADAIRGGSQKIVTLGLNWYLNSNVKLLFDFRHVDVDRLNPAGVGNTAPFGAGTATPPVGAQIGQSYNAFAIRSQFAF